jgi:hypothetical protein
MTKRRHSHSKTEYRKERRDKKFTRKSQTHSAQLSRVSADE